MIPIRVGITRIVQQPLLSWNYAVYKRLVRIVDRSIERITSDNSKNGKGKNNRPTNKPVDVEGLIGHLDLKITDKFFLFLGAVNKPVNRIHNEEDSD